MSAERRKKEALIMVALWCTVPLAALVYHTYAGGGFFLWFIVIYSGIFFFTGLPVFMGHIGLLSGYNTMSPKERSKYDTEKICRFVGICMFIISMVTFYAALPLMTDGDGFLMFWVILLLPVAGVIIMAVLLNGKRFKRDVSVWESTAASAEEENRMKRRRKRTIAAVSMIAVGTVIGVLILAVSGSVSASMDDDKLHVKAPMMNRSINFEDIVHIEFRDSFDKGTRTGGFGGTNISSGNFRNSEFGDYSLAVNNGVNAYIIVTPESGKMLVFNLNSADRTIEFYNELSGRI